MERIARGDRVVVELRAAEFFEGRVLSISRGLLRVERDDGSEPVSVSSSDVYRLPPPPISPDRDRLLVCRVDARWVGCKAERSEGGAIRVRTAAGQSVRIPPDAALQPSPLTELNLKRHFERAAERARFAAAAARAGEPERPIGFRILPRARVVARRKAGWYSGTVHEIDDAGAYIAFDGQASLEHVSSVMIVPEPPHLGTPERGEFALLRPSSPVEPWLPVRIVGVLAPDLKVVAENGDERTVPQRDLLPLTNAP